jgi:dolichyl-phosphooligosaccharide-protein glycotransferase
MALRSPLAEKLVRWLLLLGCLGLVAWIRLLPLSLPIVDQRAEDIVRRQIGQHLTQGRASTQATPFSPDGLRQAVDGWIAQHPDQFASEKTQLAGRMKARLRYQGDDGKEYVYLGDLDSYVWLRNARNYLRHGTTCDTISAGACLDVYTHAPVGGVMRYNRSLHIVSIVALHKLITSFSPHYPLPASAFLVPVVIGLLGVLPAFFLGRVVGGDIGAVFAALLSALYHQFLVRSMGSDNDIWNVVLPLFMLWALCAALQAQTTPRRAWHGVLAGVACGLHAGTWQGWRFFFAVSLGGLLASVLVSGCRHVLQQRTGRVWRSAAVKHNLLIFGVFFLSASVSVAVANAPSFSLIALATALANFYAFFITEALAVVDAGEALWPSNFAMVTELLSPDLAIIVDSFWGGLLFCASLCGLLVLFFPKTDWRWRHWAALGAGCGIFIFLVLVTPTGQRMALPLAAVPFLGTGLSALFDDDARERVPLGLALIIIVWFFAAWWLAYQGIRFLILLAPPFALGCASAAGELFVRGRRVLQHLSPRYRRVAEPVLFVGLACFLIDPLRGAHIVAQRYLPALDDAWWDTFTKIRNESSSEAIINTWWDYGYWAKYVAERRVSNDGGSLRTHIPLWIGRALVTPDESESVGVLRMLNCGSDALPYPEGQRGAHAQIRAAGHDAIATHDIVMELVHLERAAAQTYLAAKGFTSLQQEQILQTTHCTPPESYLVVASEQLLKPGSWMHLGLWDFRRAYIALRVRFMPQAAAIDDLTNHLGYTEDQATRLYTQARVLQTDEQTQSFIAPLQGFVSLGWLRCQSDPRTGAMECPIRMAVDQADSVLQSFYYRPEAPQESFFRLQLSDGEQSKHGPTTATPGVLMWADGQTLQRFVLPSPTHPYLGVLVDVPRHRMIIGSTPLVQSMMVQLLYLDGQYAKHYEKFDERTTYQGMRVVTWKIRWDGRPAATLTPPTAPHNPTPQSAPRPE